MATGYLDSDKGLQFKRHVQTRKLYLDVIQVEKITDIMRVNESVRFKKGEGTNDRILFMKGKKKVAL